MNPAGNESNAASCRAVGMADISPKMPWRVWARIHGKAICQALPIAFLIVVEGRDMYYRSTWQVQEVEPGRFESGDVIAICNRWYTLPTWSHVLYSLLSKVLLKSAWDDVGVISTKLGGTPHIVFCDFTGAHEMPLADFLRQRVPRGAAVRKLVLDAGVARPSPAVARLFVEEVGKLKVQPWHLFSASARHGSEFAYYEFCVQMNLQRQKIRDMITRRKSRMAIQGQQDKLREMDAMRQHLAKFVAKDGEFHLFNGSLVASFLATFGLLDRELPAPSRYVPQDYAHDLPFAGATHLEEPVVFFKN